MSEETKTLLGLKTDASGEFEVVFATKRDARGELAIDLDGDVYADGAIGRQPITIGCWNHGSCQGPAGIGSTFETERDIRAKGRLLMETQHGRDEFARWQALGERAEFSYIFQVRDSDYLTVGGRRVRRLKALSVISVDLVARGAAGPGRTSIVSLKSGDCSCARVDQLSECEKAELRRIRDASAEAHELQELKDLQREFTARQAKRANTELLGRFSELPEWTVGLAQRAAAEQTLKLAADRGGIAVPPLRWFADHENPNLMGFTTGKGLPVYIRADLPLTMLRHVVAHEIGHQVVGPDELAADRFAAGVA